MTSWRPWLLARLAGVPRPGPARPSSHPRTGGGPPGSAGGSAAASPVKSRVCFFAYYYSRSVRCVTNGGFRDFSHRHPGVLWLGAAGVGAVLGSVGHSGVWWGPPWSPLQLTSVRTEVRTPALLISRVGARSVLLFASKPSPRRQLISVVASRLIARTALHLLSTKNLS